MADGLDPAETDGAGDNTADGALLGATEPEAPADAPGDADGLRLPDGKASVGSGDAVLTPMMSVWARAK